MKNKAYRFYQFELDAGKRQLVFQNEIIPLRTKPFEVLSLLVERHGEVVEKQTLLEQIWRDSFVEEGNLPVYISALRRIFKKKGFSDVIRTVSGRGYVFTAPVAEITAGGAMPTEFSGGGRTVSDEARELFLKGNYIVETYVTRRNIGDELRRALEFFKAAIELEPRFVDAYVGSGRALFGLNTMGFLPKSDYTARCRALIQRLNAIAPRSSGAFFLKAVFAFNVNLDIRRAVELFRQAIELDAENAPAHYDLALCLLFLGNFDEALAHYNAALRLRPTNITYRNGLIRVYYFSWDFKRAAELAREVLEMDNRSFAARHLLASCYAELGDYERALGCADETQKLVDLPEIAIKRAYIRALMNEPEAAAELVAEIEKDEETLKANLIPVAALYAALERANEAFDLLFRYYREVGSDIFSLKTDPRLRRLHADERFQILLEELNLA